MAEPTKAEQHSGTQQPCDESGVQHLIELGYVDPDERAAREAGERRRLQAELQQSLRLAAVGRLADAEPRLQQLTVRDPEWVAPRESLADVLFRAGRCSEAQAQLDWLTYHGVEHPRLAFIAGAIALLRRDFGTALESLAYARFVEPQLPGVQTLFGTTLLRLGRLADAEETFQQAVDANASDARPYSGLAAICLRRGRYDEAANWALQAVEANAMLFQAHYQLGVALARMNRPHEAVPALEASARVDPTQIAPYYWLARIAEQSLNDAARASHYRQRASDLARARQKRRRENRGSTCAKC